MNNNVMDIAFIAAKIALIKEEKARMMVGGAMTILDGISLLIDAFSGMNRR